MTAWVKFSQAYNFEAVYINPALVASVQRHRVFNDKWTVISCGSTEHTVLASIEEALERLGIEA